MSKPVNLGRQRTLRSMVNYSFPASFIMSNLNLNLGFTYTSTPSLINNATNTSYSSTLSPGLTLNSNISQDLDFSLSYRANFNSVENSIQANLDNKYFSHTASFRLNWIFWEGFVIRSDVRNQLNRRTETNFNQNFIMWNASIGKKLFANDQGEISFQVFDLLNQNRNVNQTVSDTYLEEQQTKNLNRYFLLTFSYRLTSF
ncbi:MAG: hypothetical protein FJ217_12325 [Ignavibacteria bacterium]|nr:hypothetical protein [Ignavibacteria bacterium]